MDPFSSPFKRIALIMIECDLNEIEWLARMVFYPHFGNRVYIWRRSDDFDMAILIWLATKYEAQAIVLTFKMGAYLNMLYIRDLSSVA